MTTTTNTILFPYWSKIRNRLDYSQRTPNRVARRVLNHQSTRLANYNAEGQSRNSDLPALPNEIWYEILNYISDSQDLISCAGTCTLFKSFVDEKRTLKLFGSILPHLSKFLNWKESLKCRLVCRQWDKDVCSIANTDSRYNEPPQNECRDLEVANYLYKVRKGVHEKLEAMYDDNVNDNIFRIHCLRRYSRFFKMSTQDDLNLPPKNPFIGGRVVILLDGRREPDEPRFYSVIIRFLDNFGCYLTSLQLAIRDTTMYFQDAFFIVAHVFKNCPHLRSLWIPKKFHYSISDNFRDSIIEKFPLPDHSCIRYIDIGREDGKLDERDFLLPLLKKYSSQLCRLDLKVDGNDAEYLCALPWENLTELRVENLSSSLFLRLLRAPQLRHLSMWFIPFYISLQNLLETVNSFPKLTSLHIDMFRVCLDVKEMDNISVPIDTVLRSSITSLEITLSDPSISLDFLVCFPFVKYLVIHYKPLPRTSDRGWVIRYACGIVVGRGKLVRLFEHLGGCAALRVAGSCKSDKSRESCLYKSNIWEILPFLQTLQFTGPGEAFKIRNVFTRSEYRASRYYKTWPNGLNGV